VRGKRGFRLVGVGVPFSLSFLSMGNLSGFLEGWVVVVGVGGAGGGAGLSFKLLYFF